MPLVVSIASSPALAWRDDTEAIRRAQFTVDDDGVVDGKGYGQPGRLLTVTRR